MARKKQEPKTVADKIEQVCKDAFLEKDKPSRQYIKKAMAEKYDYTNEANIKKTLGQMVKSGKLIQEGQTFYAHGFVLEAKEYEPEEWTPLPPDKKHKPKSEGYHSNGFPKPYESEIKGSDDRSFWKLIYNMYQLGIMYDATGDESRAKTFGIAWENMLDCSYHNYEDMDKYGNYIGIGHEDMSSNMVANDVKCLRDIHGVGASVVKLIEEWIETGKLKRLEDLKAKCTASALKDIESFDDDEKEEFESKKDYMPGFLEALGELAELYEKKDDFRATSFRRAIITLEGQIITAVEDIKLFNLIELKGVGKSTLTMLEEFINDGKIEKLEEMRPQPKTNPDQVEWFATLTEEQVGYIQDWWDSEGEKKCGEENGAFGSRGIPFTFEDEGDTYKVDGDAEDLDEEGRCVGVSFEGTVYKNGVKHGTFSMRHEVDTFERDGDYSGCTLLNGEDDEDLADACRNAFEDSYIYPDNMAYRE